MESVAIPGSLWSPGAKFSDIYAESKARRVGDLVVVQIAENSSASKEAETKAERTNKADSSITNLLGLPLDRASVKGYALTPALGASSSSEFEGTGDTSRKGSIQATISARVVRVLPSNNLMIEGKKQIRVNSEVQYILLSGIIRPDDVSSNNTIASTSIADLRIDYYGNGIIGDQQRRGIVSRAMDKLWPF